MNVKELKDLIKDLPDNMDVMIDQYNDENRFALAQHVEVRKVYFKDDFMPKKEWATENCLVITDEI